MQASYSRPRLGVLTADLAARTELVGLARQLSDRYEVVIIGDVDRLNLTDIGVDVVHLGVLSTTWRNRLLSLAFRFVGQKPSPVRHYRSYHLRRLDKSTGGRVTQLRRRLTTIAATAWRGRWAYVDYLERYRPSHHASALVAALDGLLVVSDVPSDDVMSAAVRARKPILFYIYSWDHPPKFDRLPAGAAKFAVWGETMGRDLQDLNGIEPSAIEEVGATQHARLIDALDDTDRLNLVADSMGLPEKYLLVMASYGYPSLARTELRVIQNIAIALGRTYPDMLVIFKGYPNNPNPDLERAVRRLPNVTSYGKMEQRAAAVSASAAETRVAILGRAIALVHLGTTVGIEAALAGTPSIYVAMDKGVDRSFGVFSRRDAAHLSRASRQYHLMRHYSPSDHEVNVVRTLPGLSDAVGRSQSEPEQFLEPYGARLLELSNASSTSEVADAFSRALGDLGIVAKEMHEADEVRSHEC